MTDRPTVLLAGSIAARQGVRLAERLTTDWRILHWQSEDGEAALEQALAEADAMVGGAIGLALPPAPCLKLYQVPFAGYDWLDRARLPADCAVCNTYEHEIPIAEYILAAMLEWEIGIARMAADFRTGSWRYHSMSGGPHHGELLAKTIGLVGYGHIGVEVAKRAAAFGMRVAAAAHRPRPAPAPLAWLGTARDDLDRLLAESDYVAIACPLSEETEGLIDAARLAHMKPGGVIINVARGAIIDQYALYDALKEGRIGGAVLDVWYRYPDAADPTRQPADMPFGDLDNVVMTPHVSAWTMAMLERRWDFVAANLDRFARGEPLENLVTFED